MALLTVIASTLVLCQVAGAVETHPIGSLQSLATAHPDLTVWSKDEFTDETGWRRPVTWFTTHPSELHHLSFDVDGDGESDETLSGTAPHPFWLEAQRKFVPMGELKPGDVVTTANGGSATITANLRERAPPGETFTTYNFEVAEFHTYFVGAAGVWVHNTGSLWCEELVSRYQALLKIHPGETPYKTLTRVRDQILEKVDAKGTPLPKMPGEVAGRAASDIAQQMLDNYDGNIGSMPSVKIWKEDFFSILKKDGTFEGVKQGGVDLHHAVEKYIQRQLGIPDELNDLCPGIPMPRNREILDDINSGFKPANQLKQIHGGEAADGGLAGLMRSRIPDATNPLGNKDEILRRLKEVYTDPAHEEYRNIWPVTRDWLLDLQGHGFLDAALKIP